MACSVLSATAWNSGSIKPSCSMATAGMGLAVCCGTV
jgi:hypothetical protein